MDRMDMATCVCVCACVCVCKQYRADGNIHTEEAAAQPGFMLVTSCRAGPELRCSKQ